MQVTMASFRAGGIGRSPRSNVLAYSWLARTSSSIPDIDPGLLRLNGRNRLAGDSVRAEEHLVQRTNEADSTGVRDQKRSAAGGAPKQLSVGGYPGRERIRQILPHDCDRRPSGGEQSELAAGRQQFPRQSKTGLHVSGIYQQVEPRSVPFLVNCEVGM